MLILDHTSVCILVISPFKILLQHNFSYLSLNWKLYTVNIYIVQKFIAYTLAPELVFERGKGRRLSYTLSYPPHKDRHR